MNQANPFEAPRARVAGATTLDGNSSGTGAAADIPDGVKGWSWGAFFLNWIWAIGNKTWIGLLTLVPYIGFIMAFYLGIKGRELAWRNKRWDDLEHFERVQKSWSRWGLIIFFGALAIGFLAAAFDRS